MIKQAQLNQSAPCLYDTTDNPISAKPNNVKITEIEIHKEKVIEKHIYNSKYSLQSRRTTNIFTVYKTDP